MEKILIRDIGKNDPNWSLMLSAREYLGHVPDFKMKIFLQKSQRNLHFQRFIANSIVNLLGEWRVELLFCIEIVELVVYQIDVVGFIDQFVFFYLECAFNRFVVL
jgi:hypothetical protein